MSEHSFPQNDEPSRRCVHCGTTYQLHSTKPQNCVPRRDDGAEKLRREPERRILACEDADTIAGRVAELRKERDEILGKKAEE